MANNNNLTIDLKTRKDKDGKTYYVGKLKAPINIICKDGMTILVFVSDLGQEQLQIAPMDNKFNDHDD